MLFFWIVRDYFLDILDFFRDSIGQFFLDTFDTIRVILYSVLCILYKVGILCFASSFYFIYKCVREVIQGVDLKDISNLKLTLLLFFVPILIAIIKEIVKPKYY